MKRDKQKQTEHGTGEIQSRISNNRIYERQAIKDKNGLKDDKKQSETLITEKRVEREREEYIYIF